MKEMVDKPLYIGNQKVNINNEPVKGEYVEIDCETFYKISNYDKMKLMSIPIAILSSNIKQIQYVHFPFLFF